MINLHVFPENLFPFLYFLFKNFFISWFSFKNKNNFQAWWDHVKTIQGRKESPQDPIIDGSMCEEKMYCQIKKTTLQPPMFIKIHINQGKFSYKTLWTIQHENSFQASNRIVLLWLEGNFIFTSTYFLWGLSKSFFTLNLLLPSTIMSLLGIF